MPIYEYKCDNCNTCFEKLQSFSSPRTCKCPECGQEAHRLVSLGSFVLKGTGWYVTDHPSSARKAGLSNERSSKPNTSGSSKNDTKPPKKDSGTTAPKKADAPVKTTKPS